MSTTRLPGLRRISFRRLFAPLTGGGGGFPGFGGAPTSVDIGDAASAGVSGLAAQSDHEHAVPAPVLAPPDVAAASALGVLTTPARSDHTHGIGAYAFPGFGPAPAAVDIGDAGNAGAAATASRSDHEHAVPASVVAPPDIAAASSVGVATTPARSDHTHGGANLASAAWTWREYYIARGRADLNLAPQLVSHSWDDFDYANVEAT